MLVTLERAGLITRQPRVARSIEGLVDPKQPQSYSDHTQPVTITVQRY
jgi:hypothetical protein